MQPKVILFFFLLLSVSNSFAQNWTTELDSVLQILEKDSLFDGQILIAEKGKILFHKAYGQHELADDHSSITTETSFGVNSVGKSFTALAIMLLEDKGQLAYDDKVSKFIPGFPYADVSIRHLLTMTSGLPRMLTTALEYADTTQVISNPEIIDLLLEHQPEAGPAGVRFAYNNTNYILLASIVETVSGQSFSGFLQQHIFGPLRMQHTYEKTPKLIDSLTRGTATADNFYQGYGAGSVATTAGDLFRYDQALYSGQLLVPEQLEAAFTPMRLQDGTYSNYGFGWRVHETENEKEIYHVGDGENMRASIQRFTKSRKTLIYIHPYTNSYHQEVYQAVRNIWEQKPYELPTKRKIYAIDTSLFEQYTGSYLSNFGLVHITSENDKLYLRPDPIPGKEELVPSSDTTFYFANQNLEWEFFLNETGEVVGFGLKGDRERMGVRQE